MTLAHENLMYTVSRSIMSRGCFRRRTNWQVFTDMRGDQWLRASQSIPFNIAEGNGKTTDPDRRKFFEIARGSALECAAIQDVLRVGDALDEVEHDKRKKHLDRMAMMLSRLGGRGYCVEDAQVQYGSSIDFDDDSDLDFDGKRHGEQVAVD